MAPHLQTPANSNATGFEMWGQNHFRHIEDPVFDLSNSCSVENTQTSEVDQYISISELVFDLWSRNGKVLHPSSNYTKRFNEFFTITFLIAVATDPLFFFIVFVNVEGVCIEVNLSMAIVLTIVRTFTDIIYLLHILLEFRTGFTEKIVHKDSWWPWERSRKLLADPGDIVYDRQLIASNYMRGWFCLDILSIIPLPQIVVWAILPSTGFVGLSSLGNIVRVIILLQTIPRLIRLLPYLSGSYQAKGFLFESSSANFVLNVIVYFVVAHVIGCVWYLLALSRIGDCFISLCSQSPCNRQYFDCTFGIKGLAADIPRQNWVNGSAVMEGQFLSGSTMGAEDILNFCSLAPNITVFNFGLYMSALAISHDSSSFRKYFSSFFWGFQQLTTFAGNQMPSPFIPEVLFITFVAFCGLLLFTLLIGNIQGFLTSLTRRTFDYQLRRRDVDNWMRSKNINRDLQLEVRKYERLLWDATRGVSDSEIIEGLPHDLQRKLFESLTKKLISQSEMLSSMDEHVLDAIRQQMKRQVFVKGTNLFRQGSPVTRMYFIEKGEVSSRRFGGVYTSAIINEVHRSGSCLGEELLLHVVQLFSRPKTVSNRIRVEEEGAFDVHMLPLSERTIVCVKDVICFSLEAATLVSICKQYSGTFLSVRMTMAIEMITTNRKQHAAISIQVRWRRFVRRKFNIGIKELHEAKLRGLVGSLIQQRRRLPSRSDEIYEV